LARAAAQSRKAKVVIGRFIAGDRKRRSRIEERGSAAGLSLNRNIDVAASYRCLTEVEHHMDRRVSAVLKGLDQHCDPSGRECLQGIGAGLVSNGQDPVSTHKRAVNGFIFVRRIPAVAIPVYKHHTPDKPSRRDGDIAPGFVLGSDA